MKKPAHGNLIIINCTNQIIGFVAIISLIVRRVSTVIFQTIRYRPSLVEVLAHSL